MAGIGMGNGFIQTITIFLYVVIIFSRLHFTSSQSTGFSLRVIPVTSPQSPLYSGNLTELQSIQRLINISKARATTTRSFNDRKDIISLFRDEFYYMAEISIGTPPVTTYLLLDTGSSLVWTQCKPCINCYPQEDPLFDPEVSSTYQKLTCDHPLCLDQHSNLHCYNGSCVYGYNYVNEGLTKGIAAMETFRFPTDEHQHNVSILDDIVFGCSNDNEDFELFYRNGLISGVLGLNLAPESLFNQLSDHMEKVFSYCIVPFTLTLTNPSVFKFGDHVFIPPGHFPAAPYFTYEGIYNYYLHLRDLSVGDQSLEFPSGTFDPSSSNFFIDSSSITTKLVTNTLTGINVYQKVLTAFQNHYDSHHLKRLNSSDSPSDLELCYHNRPGFNDFPSMTFHFEGGDFVVGGKYVNININVESPGIFCVAIMASEGSDSVLGAIHQQDKRIIHNGNINAIQFYPEDCANDHL